MRLRLVLAIGALALAIGATYWQRRPCVSDAEASAVAGRHLADYVRREGFDASELSLERVEHLPDRGKAFEYIRRNPPFAVEVLVACHGTVTITRR